MAAPPTVILSPHLDDAVLSCWHLLGGLGDVRVINVFAGSPPPDNTVGWWDRVTGATDSATRMKERWDEDREALAVANRTAINLDFLDAQYNPDDQPMDEIVAGLRDLIDPRSIVYAPASLGEHGDHRRVREAALVLASSGQSVRLYADHPHAVHHGWPGWVEGTESRPGRAVAEHWDRRLGEVGLAGARADVHHLDATERDRKLRAASAYRTQIPALRSTFGEVEGFPAFPHEVVWTFS